MGVSTVDLTADMDGVGSTFIRSEVVDSIIDIVQLNNRTCM